MAHRYKSSTIVWLGLVTGIAILAAPLIWSTRAGHLQEIERKKWKDGLEKSPNEGFRIVVPKIGVDAVVVEETKESDLDRGPMHLAGTAFPGEPGNCCIAAHKEKWFRRLGDLAPDDIVTVDSAGRRYEYTIVDRKIVRSDNLTVLENSQAATVSLITCTGPAFFGRGKGRLVLVGILTKVK